MTPASRDLMVRVFTDPKAFFSRTRESLEENEPANSLMLGICERLLRQPERFEHEPCLRTVEDQGDILIAALMTPPHNLVLHGLPGDLRGAASVLIEGLLEGLLG